MQQTGAAEDWGWGVGGGGWGVGGGRVSLLTEGGSHGGEGGQFENLLLQIALTYQRI